LLAAATTLKAVTGSLRPAKGGSNTTPIGSDWTLHDLWEIFKGSKSGGFFAKTSSHFPDPWDDCIKKNDP